MAGTASCWIALPSPVRVLPRPLLFSLLGVAGQRHSKLAVSPASPGSMQDARCGNGGHHARRHRDLPRARAGKALCKLYQARPTQCRTWPFWQEVVESAETWDQAANGCPPQLPPKMPDMPNREASQDR